MPILTPEILEAVGGPIAAGLIPAWRVTWLLLAQEELDAFGAASTPPLPGPNLAIVSSLPERRMATARVVNPFPDGESLGETLHHELGHAWIAPLTAQIPQTEASVLLEEQLVETLGVYLATLAPAQATAARRALGRVVDRYAPALRARMSARAPLARGGTMDPKMIMEALDALIGGDAEKCQEILKGLIASAAGGGAVPAPTMAEPDGDEAAMKPATEGAPMADKQPPEAGAPSPVGPPKPAEDARAAARLGQIDGEHARARKAADAAVSITVRARIREMRQDGIMLPTNLESDLGKMTDLDRFEQRIADITAGRSLAAPGGTRARGAVAPVGGHGSTPAPTDSGAAAPLTADQLRAEGASEDFVATYAAISAADANAAAGLLAGFRAPDAVASRARLHGMGPTGRALRTVPR